jgi:hypothetical protein
MKTKPTPRDVRALARDYAQHMINTGQMVAHVFPVKSSGRGHAADFRRYLAYCLAYPDRSSDYADRAIYAGSRYLYKLDSLRIHHEMVAYGRGYVFSEVNPADYS